MFLPMMISLCPSRSTSSSAMPTLKRPRLTTPLSEVEGRYQSSAPSLAMITSVLPSPSISAAAVAPVSVACAGAASRTTYSHESLPPLGGRSGTGDFCKAGWFAAILVPWIPAAVTVPAISLPKLRLSMALSQHIRPKKGPPLQEAALHGKIVYWRVRVNVVEAVMLVLLLSAAVTVMV